MLEKCSHDEANLQEEKQKLCEQVETLEKDLEEKTKRVETLESELNEAVENHMDQMTESDNETKDKHKKLIDEANSAATQCHEAEQKVAALKEQNLEMNAKLIDTSGQLDVC